MSQENLIPQSPQRAKKEARSTKNKLGAVSKPKREAQAETPDPKPRPVEASSSLNKAETLFFDSWGCDPELSLTGSHFIEPLTEAETVPPPVSNDLQPKLEKRPTVAPLQRQVLAPVVPQNNSIEAKEPGLANTSMQKQSAIPEQKRRVEPLVRKDAAQVSALSVREQPGEDSDSVRSHPALPRAMHVSNEPVLEEVIPDCGGGSGETPESLAHLSEAALNVIAGNPRTAASTLCWLAAHYNPEIRSTVARNSNALPETVWLLAKDHDQAVRLAIAEHLESNRDVLRALSDDPSPLVSWRAQNTLSLVAGGAGKTPSVDTSLVKEEWARRNRAKQSAGRQPEGGSQSKSPEEVGFLLLVAQKPTTPLRRLTELAAHNNAKIRAAVAENANAPLDALWLLSRDAVCEVKVKLADNYNCPLEIIEALSNDSDQYVVWRARTVLAKLTGQSFPELAEESSRVSSRLVHSR